MTYESMIDNMNEYAQLDFFEYSVETIGLNESFDIKAKFESIKNAVIGAIRTVRKKVSDIISYIRSKFKNNSVKEKAKESSEKINKIDDQQKKQVVEKVAAKYTTGNESVEKKGPGMVEASGAELLIYEIDDQAAKEVFADQEEMITDLTKISDSLKNPKMATNFIMVLHGKKSKKYENDAKEYQGVGSEKGDLLPALTKLNPIKVKIVSAATIHLIVSNYEKADQYLAKENSIIDRFNKQLNITETKVNSCKQEEFRDGNAFNSFKKLSKNLIYNIKTCFNALKAITVSLASDMKDYERLLTIVNQIIVTYNADI